LTQFKFTNYPSRVEPLTSEFERANELRAFRPALVILILHPHPQALDPVVGVSSHRPQARPGAPAASSTGARSAGPRRAPSPRAHSVVAREFRHLGRAPTPQVRSSPRCVTARHGDPGAQLEPASRARSLNRPRLQRSQASSAAAFTGTSLSSAALT
jgi:hypothetical protein